MTHRKITVALVVAAALNAAVGATALAQQIGSWGDQGDGTYRNPILNADYPDVDVEQRGDTYYMISSKQHMAPGMVILESKDMVNWTTLGHVWPRLSWDPKYDGEKMAGYSFGVWAGDLAYHDGRWYCYQIDTTNGLYMSSAEDILGPWTQPHLMLARTRWTDPAVFWDDEAHQAYLIGNYGNVKGKGNELRLFKMSPDGRELLDDGVPIHYGTGAEAAKIYRHDGRWYIFFAQWFRPDPRRPKDPNASTGDRKQMVMRSKTDSIYGPYETRVVYERGNGVIRSSSQGALMQAPDGSWWYTHQLIQNIPTPFQGRPQMLQPVKWVDGWPEIGRDADGDGIGEPVLRHKKPISGFPLTAPPTDDAFAGRSLGHQWEWNHNPRDTHWSLTERPGWLRLKASVPVGKGGFWNACNTLSQRLMGTTTGEATATFDLAGMEPGQRAGFVRFGGVYHLLGVHVEADGARRLFFSDNGKAKPGPRLASDLLWIRTTNEGNQARFLWSTDGTTFTAFGPTFTVKFGRWTGDRLGFFCWNDRREAGHIDIDWFRYDYDGPKAAAKDFLTGGDVSLLRAIQEEGGTWKADGKPKDPLAIFRDHGCNTMRLRLFHTPTGKGGVVNSLAYTQALGRRIKEAGFRLLLDIHYSDTWADPGHQVTPKAWQGLDPGALCEAVRAYTRDVVRAMDDAGARPDIVQVGNEIGHGMLWPTGKLSKAPAERPRLATLVKAGVRGVREAEGAGPPIAVMIHHQAGGSPGAVRWFFDYLAEFQVPYDLIGLSYYPWWHGTLDDLTATLDATAERFRKDIVLVETATLYKPGREKNREATLAEPHAGYTASPEGQNALLERVIQIVRRTPGGHGRGVLWWAPEVIAAGGRAKGYQDRALFDADGNALPALSAFAEFGR